MKREGEERASFVGGSRALFFVVFFWAGFFFFAARATVILFFDFVRSRAHSLALLESRRRARSSASARRSRDESRASAPRVHDRVASPGSFLSPFFFVESNKRGPPFLLARGVRVASVRGLLCVVDHLGRKERAGGPRLRSPREGARGPSDGRRRAVPRARGVRSGDRRAPEKPRKGSQLRVGGRHVAGRRGLVRGVARARAFTHRRFFFVRVVAGAVILIAGWGRVGEA